ncbi:MAG: hypothetical protein ACE15E_11730 [Acidobacteriota bacterium]
MLSADPRRVHPNRFETGRQMVRATEKERGRVVEIKGPKRPESVIERVKERSETGKHRKPKAEMRVGAAKTEMMWGEAMEAKGIETEPEVAKAQTDMGTAKTELMWHEAMEAEWPEAEVAKAEMCAGAWKAEVVMEA